MLVNIQIIDTSCKCIYHLLIVPTPPHGVQAIHVVIGTSNAHLVVIWNQMVKQNTLSNDIYKFGILLLGTEWPI